MTMPSVVASAPPKELWLECIELVRQQRPRLLQEYLDRHGLRELPPPQWVDVENATVWHRTRDGSTDSCRHRLLDPSGGALILLLERDFMLAPQAAQMPAARVEAAESQQHGEDESRPGGVSDKPFPCGQTFSNGRVCRRAYTTKKRLANHVARAHGGTT